MALHLRIQIRDAVQTLLTGLATTGTNVFVKPQYNLPVTSLPCLIVHVGSEAITQDDTFGGMPREAVLEIEATAQQTGDIEAKLGQIIKEIEVQMATDVQLGALADLTSPVEISDMVENVRAAQPASSQTITYTVKYSTREGVPDVPA